MLKHSIITTIIIPVLLISVLFCVLFSWHCYAKLWRDSFDEDLTGWERIGRGSRWESVAGILFANIQCVEQPFCDEEYIAGFLHWKVVEFNFEQLTMIGEEITYPQEGEDGMGELCLFLGKRQDEPELAAEGYIVSPEEISRVTFSEKKDGYSRGKTKAWYGNIFKDTTRNLTVVFDSGHFQVWTSNLHLITELSLMITLKLLTLWDCSLRGTLEHIGLVVGSQVSQLRIKLTTVVLLFNYICFFQAHNSRQLNRWGLLKQFE